MEPRRYNRLNVAPSDSPKGENRVQGGKNLTLLGEKLDCKRYKMTSSLCVQLKAYAFAKKAIGQLVQLGFDVAAFTPAAYQRPRLGRPSMEISSCGRLRA